jgi:hypothetical protein
MYAEFKKLLILTLFLLLPLSQAEGQQEPVMRGLHAINEDVLKAQLAFLASDWMEGRQTGEKGEYLAADYIASMLQLFGVKPGGDYPETRVPSFVPEGTGRSYFQNFVLLKTTDEEKKILKIISGEGPALTTLNLVYDVDFISRSLASDIEIEAPVVFAGYGFRNERIRYDDFGKLDLKGKFVLKIAGIPDFVTRQLSTSEILASVRETETMLREAGAAGIIEFNPSSKVTGSTVRPEFLNMSPAEINPNTGRRFPDYSLPGTTASGLFPRITVSVKTANEILRGTGISWEEHKKRSDSNQPNKLQALKGISLFYKSERKTTPVTVRNVIGVIEGKKPDEIIVLGAHYDHMGMENGYIWNGADDNGSGTVGIMTLAKAIMATGQKPDRTIIIALWTAEEAGLLGSRHFVENLAWPAEKIKFNLNLDMISRYIADDDRNKVIMTYTSSHPEFRDITEANIKRHGIELIVDYQPSDNPPGGSDHRSFVAAGIPIMRFKPGHRQEYHTPADELRTINWDIMEKIVKICFANVWELAGGGFER